MIFGILPSNPGGPTPMLSLSHAKSTPATQIDFPKKNCNKMIQKMWPSPTYIIFVPIQQITGKIIIWLGLISIGYVSRQEFL